MAMDPDRKAFLDAIAANPADDNVRLVYADWLQEHGEDDRAEYIRQFIAFVNLTQRGPTQIHGLYKKCFHPYFGIPEDHHRPFPMMERGFVAKLDCSWGWWCANADRLLETEWVPRVVFPEEPPLIRSHSQRVDEQKGIQIITLKVRSTRGLGNKIAQCEYWISEREMRTAAVYAMGIGIEHLEHKLTTPKCLKLWWPDTKFEWPGMPREDPISAAVERMARERAEVEEVAVRDIASAHGLGLPNDAQLISRLEFSSERPPPRMLCDCPRLRRFGWIESDSPRAEDHVIQEIELNQRVYNSPPWLTSSGRRWLVHYGQCPRCRTVYYGLTPEPLPSPPRPDG